MKRGLLSPLGSTQLGLGLIHSFSGTFYPFMAHTQTHPYMYTLTQHTKDKQLWLPEKNVNDLPLLRCAFDQAQNSTKRELGYSCRSARQEVRDGVRVAMGMSMGMGNGDVDEDEDGEDSSCALQACA